MIQKKDELNITSFQDIHIRMRNFDGYIQNVMPYLGAIDAEKEWNDDPENAYKKFLHTRSFSSFLSDDALILLGRTGTGKTAILRSICECVKTKRITEYDHAIIVPFDEMLNVLFKTQDNYNEGYIAESLKNLITMYINCYVMKELINQNEKPRKNSKMRTYLVNNHFYNPEDDNFSQTGINRLQRVLEVGANGTGRIAETISEAVTVTNVIAALKGSEYEEAYKEMKKELQDKRVLVLIDTLNEYDLKDDKTVISIKALIATCFSFYNSSKNRNIFVKISIPSEIHTHLIEMLPGKQQGNTVVIQWSNNDLIKMIAIRLLYYSRNKGKKYFHFDDHYQYSDFYDDNPKGVDNAKTLLYEVLPKTCPTSLDYYFDTLAYCIKHTLKKPREVMMIFNYMIRIIQEKHNQRFFIENPEEISRVIHATQDEMVPQVLSTYTKTYRFVSEGCDIVLRNLNYYFKGAELKDRLKDAAVTCRCDPDDIRRVLLESGLVGIISDVSYPEILNRSETETQTIQFVKARFEYQVKGKLPFNREGLYVVHPMCYEHFECSVGSHTLVYPSGFDDDMVIKSVKLKES